MSEDSVEVLIRQLNDVDQKVRQQACYALARLADPTAIPAIVRLYNDPDEVPAVKKAATQALEKFGSMVPSSGQSTWPRYASIGLSLSLVVLLLLNVVLRLGGGDEETVTPTPSGPSDRAALIAEYQTLLADAKADAATLREQWRESGQLNCSVTLKRPKEQPLSAVDQAVFPDFGFVIQLNQAIFQLNNVPLLRFDQECDAGTNGSNENAIASSKTLDSIDALLLTAEDQLNRAVTNPLPTLLPPGG